MRNTAPTAPPADGRSGPDLGAPVNEHTRAAPTIGRGWNLRPAGPGPTARQRARPAPIPTPKGGQLIEKLTPRDGHL
jgi:hypothetical protein